MSYKFSIIVLISIFFIQSAAISTDPMFQICSESQYFITNSDYHRNLRKLLINYLSYKTPPTGFGLGSKGHGYDRTYGLALCRGDASSNDCKACVLAASSEILKLCPNDKVAIIWYESCYLKYTDGDFLGKIDEDQLFMWNLNNVSMIEPQKLDQMVHELLANLSQKASEISDELEPE